jgi:tetratricopeptide (TPR) repeat protein
VTPPTIRQRNGRDADAVGWKRARLLFLLPVLLLTGRAFGQEDARDAERRFRFLLSRSDELRKQADEMNGEASPAAEARIHAQEHRLENDYRHFLNDHPLHTRAMVAFGDFLSDQQREDEAMKWWEKAIKVDPQEAYAYNDIANYYGHNGRAADALKLYDKAIALAPAEPIFRFNWATTCVTFRNQSREVYGWTNEEIFQRSLDQFRRARDLDPQNFDLATAYAETFYMVPKANWEAAYAAWKYCLNLQLNEPQRQLVFMHLARVCIHRERYDEAREWAAKLSAGNPVRRALERQMAEKDKKPSTGMKAPATSAAEPAGKPQ